MGRQLGGLVLLQGVRLGKVGGFLRVVLHRLSAGPALVIAGKVAELAEALRVVHLILMRALPGLLCAAASMVAIDAHALGVVALVGVRALEDLLFLADLVASWDA